MSCLSNGCTKNTPCENCKSSDSRVLASTPRVKVESCDFPSMKMPTIPSDSCFDKIKVGLVANNWVQSDSHRCSQSGDKQTMWYRTVNGKLEFSWVNNSTAPVECLSCDRGVKLVRLQVECQTDVTVGRVSISC